MSNVMRSRMRLLVSIFLIFAARAAAQPAGSVETRPLTLQQAVALALRQNPDYLLARLDEQRARLTVREARSPYYPQVALGSGLAYSSGFPLSIAGSAPSILQAVGTQFLYNRPQSFRIREAGEMANAAARSTEAKADEIAFRIAATYLDFERASRALASSARQLDSLARIERVVEERVRAGRELPLELTRARVQTARARSRVNDLQANVEFLEETLRTDLGLGDSIRITPVETQLPAQAPLPEKEEIAVSAALSHNKEIKRLECLVQAKQYAIKAERAVYFPRLDLVAQYAMLGRFNHYEDFFRTFERHNGQLGGSFQVPLFARAQVAPRVAQVELEVTQHNLRLAAARGSTALETRRLFREVRQAESARDLARLELDLARETLSVVLAQLDEGRVSLRQVEEARVSEFQKWESFYDAQTVADKARLNLLRQTGELLAALH